MISHKASSKLLGSNALFFFHTSTFEIGFLLQDKQNKLENSGDRTGLRPRLRRGCSDE